MKNRSKAEAYILKFMKDIDPSMNNFRIYKEKFSKMTDNQFHKYMTDMKEGKTQLVVYSANMVNNLTTTNLKNVAEKYNVSLFDHIDIWDNDLERFVRTSTKYLIVDVPIRRLKQTLSEKISVPDNDRVRSVQTDQVTGDSKGSSVSLIEAQIAIDKGLDEVVNEFFNIRGGNLEAVNTLKSVLENKGSVSSEDLKNVTTRPKVVQTVKSILHGMHIQSNL